MASVLDHARAGDEAAFRELTEPHRRELLVHAYRILGSLQDAEDAVQETLLAAWRGLGGFEERASLRTWLYRIATNRCLNALRTRPEPSVADLPEPTRYGEPLFLQPYPDVLLEGVPDTAPGPDARYELREAVGLAFLSALHRLPARQRTVLVLRDVLGYSAAETAEMLDTTAASVTSALQRARAAVEDLPPRAAVRPAERELLGRFGEAFEAGDVDAIVALLTEDAWLRMPPEPHEYRGHAAIAAFLRTRSIWQPGRGIRLVPTRANGDPAFAYYVEDGELARAGGMFVLSLADDRISALTRFGDLAVLPHFGLPRTLRASARA